MLAASDAHPAWYYGLTIWVFIGVPLIYFILYAMTDGFNKGKRKHRDHALWQSHQSKSRWRGGGPS